ncbi:MAG: TRAP transporter small permease [Burkholderiales bacterium]
MRLRRALEVAVQLSFAVSALALLVMVFVLVADVAMANLLRRPISGTFDVVETTLVFLVFLGFPITFLRGGHIAVDIIDHVVSPETVRRLKVLAWVITLAFLVFFAWQMTYPALDAFRFGERKQELGLPLWVLWLPMIFGIGLSAATLVAVLIRGDAAPKDDE